MMHLNDIGLFLLNGDQYSGRGNEGYWNTVGTNLAEALSTSGQMTIPLNVWQDPQAMRLFAHAHSQPPKFCFTFNMIPNSVILRQPDPRPDIQFEPLKSMQTRHLSGLFDHPMHLVSKIKDNIVQCPNLEIGILDPKHRTFMNRLGLPDRQVFDFLFGGPPLQPDRLDMSDRPIDILFTGGIQPLESEQDFIARFTGDPALKKAFQAAIARILNENEDVFEIVYQEIQSVQPDTDFQTICDYSIVIDRYTRIVTRHQILNALKDLHIHIAGPVPAELLGPNMTQKDNVSFGETLKLMGRSRLVISDTINMRDGLVLRPFYAMAHGAVILAQPNGFWRKHFRDNHDYIALDLQNPLQGKELANLLDDLPTLQTVANSMAQSYESAHTWIKRIENSPTLRSLLS